MSNFKLQGSLTGGFPSNVIVETGSDGWLRKQSMPDFKNNVGEVLNSEKLGGLDSSQFLRSDVADTASQSITFTNNIDVETAVGLSFEDGNHTINNNDGGGNFNIRVGNTYSAGITEAGYAMHQSFSQATGHWAFNITSASQNVGQSPVWNSVLFMTSSGDLTVGNNVVAQYFNTDTPLISTLPTSVFIETNNDSWIRKQSFAEFKDNLGTVGNADTLNGFDSTDFIILSETASQYIDGRFNIAHPNTTFSPSNQVDPTIALTTPGGVNGCVSSIRFWRQWGSTPSSPPTHHDIDCSLYSGFYDNTYNSAYTILAFTDDVITATPGYVAYWTFTQGGLIGPQTTMAIDSISGIADTRLIDIQEPVTGALNTISGLRAVKCNANNIAKNAIKSPGVDRAMISLLSQDVEAVEPSMVATAGISQTYNTNGSSTTEASAETIAKQTLKSADYKAIKYSEVTAILVSAMQELADTIDQLTTRIDVLKNA